MHRDDFASIVKSKVTLDGDNRKGHYVLALSIIRNVSNNDRELDILDLECSRIEYYQDKLESRKNLITKLRPSLHRIKNSSGTK